MESIKELYRIGYGPSSSHTMGPRYAAQRFLSEYPDSVHFEADLFGSLAATGKGHLTDSTLRQVFGDAGKELVVHWFPEEYKSFHPNALALRSYDDAGTTIAQKTYYSVGGGKIIEEGELASAHKAVYPKYLTKMSHILAYCRKEGIQLWELVVKYEGPGIFDFIEEIWTVMVAAIERGLEAEGVLPGGLKLPRKATQFFAQAKDMSGPVGTPTRALSYALAVAEENAGGGKIVTAPTCGSCGVLPGVLYYMRNQYKLPKIKILRALLTAGLIGNLVKTNGSISGAEVGCQGEVGVACAMASGAVAQLLGGSIHQIEYAAEMGLEHHLGLTCDPMMGLVQIPCIERNALGAMRALDHASYALLSDGHHKVSFDMVVDVMMETGQALPSLYRETSLGGLAKIRH
ncbi:MAG: L-serine ammonia-lyase [Sphaerochaetaceae bacterium]|jgi:L-serine dehydratase|nr:L-serine ammonia-lyase [Sphaerochaetaceae bacterium]MDX9938821.1 L-serine ammonia-lyase [Sphaerochaetaceae bacterium]